MVEETYRHSLGDNVIPKNVAFNDMRLCNLPKICYPFAEDGIPIVYPIILGQESYQALYQV